MGTQAAPPMTPREVVGAAGKTGEPHREGAGRIIGSPLGRARKKDGSVRIGHTAFEP
jgi:hypothetical protein